MIELRTVRRGSPVLAADGERVGRVLRSSEQYLVVVRGHCFAEHYFVRGDQVAGIEHQRVRLCVRADALQPDTDSEAWDPPLDPLGTDDGVDIEPLRAGMAEVDARQRSVPVTVQRPPLVRHATASDLPRARSRPPEVAAAPGATPGSTEAAIDAEIADLERAGSCADPDDPPRGG
jgi:hypothetical protein